MKVVVLICLGSDSREKAMKGLRKRVNWGSGKWYGEGQLKLEPGFQIEDLIDAFLEQNEPIAKYFFCGYAGKLQLIESQIAEQVMLRFAELGKPIFPVHDSFIVRQSDALILKGAMMECYSEHPKLNGFSPVVDIPSHLTATFRPSSKAS